MFKTKIIRALSQNKRILNRYERILAINDIHVDLEQILSKPNCDCAYGWEGKFGEVGLNRDYRGCKKEKYDERINSRQMKNLIICFPFIIPSMFWFEGAGIFMWTFASVMYNLGGLALEKDFNYCCGKDLEKYKRIIMNKPKKQFNEEARVKSLIDKIGAERDKN